MRNTLFFLFLLLCAAPATAQTFRASALAGINLGQIDGDSLIGFRQPGINAGLRVVAMLSENWRAGPEILFSQQGARQRTRPAFFSSYDDIRINTVEVPLMIYFKEWRFTAEAGLSYNRVFTSEIRNFQQRDISAERPLKEQFLNAKVGVTMYFTPNLGLNVRWSKSLTDIDLFPQHNFRTRYLSIRMVFTPGAGERMPERPEEEDGGRR